MTARKASRWLVGVGTIALASTVLSTPALARGRVGVFIGGTFGYPGPYYPYPPYAYYPYPAYPYPIEPAAPPPGWVPGHFEWRYDAWERPVRVWVPAHLQ